MIWSFLTQGLYFVVGGIIQFLPNSDPTTVTYIQSQTVPFRNILVGQNWWFPVDVLMQILRYTFTLFAAALLWLLIRYVSGLFTGGITK